MIETIFGLNPQALGAGLLAAIVGLVAVFLRGSKAGKDAAKADDVKAAQKANKIESDNARISDAQVKERLKSKWQKL